VQKQGSGDALVRSPLVSVSAGVSTPRSGSVSGAHDSLAARATVRCTFSGRRAVVSARRPEPTLVGCQGALVLRLRRPTQRIVHLPARSPRVRTRLNSATSPPRRRQLNPDAYLNDDVKLSIAKRARARDRATLLSTTTPRLGSLQQQPDQVSKFLHHPRVRSATCCQPNSGPTNRRRGSALTGSGRDPVSADPLRRFVGPEFG